MTSQLSTVIGFEVRRVVRRRSFWAAALLIPVVMVAVVLIVTWSSNTASQNATAITQGSFEYSDASGLVQPDIATKFGGKPVGADPVARVKAGTLDAYIAYPADPAAQPTQVTAKDLGVIKNATYSTIASSVFAASVEAALDSPQTTAYIREGIKTVYRGISRTAGGPAEREFDRARIDVVGEHRLLDCARGCGAWGYTGGGGLGGGWWRNWDFDTKDCVGGTSILLVPGVITSLLRCARRRSRAGCCIGGCPVRCRWMSRACPMQIGWRRGIHCRLCNGHADLDHPLTTGGDLGRGGYGCCATCEESPGVPRPGPAVPWHSRGTRSRGFPLWQGVAVPVVRSVWLRPWWFRRAGRMCPCG